MIVEMQGRAVLDRNDAARLFELGDLIHAVARQLRPPEDMEPGICTALDFSRVLRGLEAKGLVRRIVDPNDARMVRLNLTPLAERNFDRMREAWSQALAGIVDDPNALDVVNDVLRRIENVLTGRRG